MARINRITVVLFLLPSIVMSEFLWSPAYDSVEQAAIAALEYVAASAAEDSTPTEYLGIVYELNGKFLFTVPVEGDANEALVSDIQWPAQATMAALYHNHVSGDGNEEFSSIDIRTATKLKVPTYIYVTDTGEVRRWHPEDRGSIHYRRGRFNPQTPGHLVTRFVLDTLSASAER